MNESPDFTLVEAGIADLRQALEAGAVTSVELVGLYLNRIAYFDRQGLRLNAVPVLNPAMFEEARASDARRAGGRTLGPLDGIPYTAKDSYKAAGLTVAAGSPAFEDLVAQDDAYTIARLRAAGAVLLGLTNMPPMANGGMQRGVYGRAESPYNAKYLTAAFGSGSSNGSGTATAASFAAFGLGEETWSSGRAPASNNGLVAYTPSRGVISVRGNWPLVPTMDVVVPHTRSMDDLLEVLDVIVDDDPQTRGDFWRVQPWVEIPAASAVRPASYKTLGDPGIFAGKRLGVPRMYINRDTEAANPIQTRASVVELWEQAAKDLEALGAEVVEVDFPVVSNYEKDRPGTASMVDRGIVPNGFADAELWDLSIWSWDDFLRSNADPHIGSLAEVDGAKIFPQPPGALPDQYGDDDIDLARYVERARAGVPGLEDISHLAEGLRGLEETRRVDFEDWLDELGLDAVVFPAVADVGPADADVHPASAELAWRNGTWVANGNLVPRHLGIPTVTVPMGLMADIGMPVGLTFAGKAYDDSALLAYGKVFESFRQRRSAPQRTPALQQNPLVRTASPAEASAGGSSGVTIDTKLSTAEDGSLILAVTGKLLGSAGIDQIAAYVNGSQVKVVRSGQEFSAAANLPAGIHDVPHSTWRQPYGSLVCVVVRDGAGETIGAFAGAGGLL